MLSYRPEEIFVRAPDEEHLRRAVDTEEICHGMCVKCDEFQNLHVDLGNLKGIIPREETAIGVREGTAKGFSIISRVGKSVSFRVLSVNDRIAILSRRAAQETVRAYYMTHAQPGDILPVIIQNPAPFGAFCDVGCGLPALMRIDRCCISRLENPAQLFRSGQSAYAVILNIDSGNGRIELSGRELLGTWEENAAMFRNGQTVTGVVRSIMPYGIFIELTPNLSGLAELQSDIAVGDNVSVSIRSIQHDKKKIKLKIQQLLPPGTRTRALQYFKTDGHMDKWEYYPGSRAVTYF